MIMKHETLEEDWTNNEDWLKSYNFNRSFVGEERNKEDNFEDFSIDNIEEEIEEYTKLSEEDKMYENDMIEIEENNIIFC